MLSMRCTTYSTPVRLIGSNIQPAAISAATTPARRPVAAIAPSGMLRSSAWASRNTSRPLSRWMTRLVSFIQ